MSSTQWQGPAYSHIGMLTRKKQILTTLLVHIAGVEIKDVEKLAEGFPLARPLRQNSMCKAYESTLCHMTEAQVGDEAVLGGF